MPTVNGYETLPLLSAHVAALKRELAHPRNEWHAEAVKGQLGFYTPHLERMRAEAQKKAKARIEAEEAAW